MILVLDDHPLARQGLESIIKLHKPDEEILQAGSIEEARKILERENIEIAFIDVNLGKEDGFDFLKILREKKSGVKTFLITSSSKQTDFMRAKEFDVDAYVLKDAFIDEIVYGLSVVERNGKFYSSNLIEAMKDSDEDLLLLDRLTERELEILALLGEGKSNMEIADSLIISEGTVKKHISNILGKILLKNRVTAVLFGNKNRSVIDERLRDRGSMIKVV